MPKVKFILFNLRKGINPFTVNTQKFQLKIFQLIFITNIFVGSYRRVQLKTSRMKTVDHTSQNTQKHRFFKSLKIRQISSNFLVFHLPGNELISKIYG